MKGVSRHVFVRIVQAIIMKHLVYCFKLDEFEFNLKSKYKNTILLYRGIQELCMQYM